MSKCIRTKWGEVWEVESETETHFYVDDIFDYEIEKKDIIKQANTIEELCDGFFLKIYGNDFSRDAIGSRDTFKQFKEAYSFYKNHEKCDGFGFIETDKGLIYVAKLNDKGELELI